MPIKLNGATSGSVELDVPDAIGSDVSGVLLPTTAGTLDRLERAGNILQVVNGQTAVGVNQTTSGYIDTGLTASITPTSATSKILVLVNQVGCYKNNSNTWILLKLFKDTVDLATFEAVGGYTNSTSESNIGSCSICYLDSPSTTSSVTYKTLFASQTGGASVGVQRNGSMSTITLLEVAA